MDKYDYSGVPTAMCICGSTMFNAIVQFDPDDYTINFYWTDGTCADCNAKVTLPTEPDHPKYKEFA